MSLTYNWNIKGHTTSLIRLEKDLVENKLVHAYLFAGPPNIGKFTIAKTMANILQCPNNYCRNCSICREIEKSYHSDTLELIDNGESIKIEMIRELNEKIAMSAQNRYKVVLIQNIERMTVESANAMLKSLEEPPEKVLFILTTSSLQKVLPTVLSRVRTIHFYRLEEQELKTLLKENYPLLDEEMINHVLAFSMGRPGKAFQMLQHPEIYESYRVMYSDIEIFLQKPDRIEQFLYIENLVKDDKSQTGAIEITKKQRIKDFLDLFLIALRQQLLQNVTGNATYVPLDKACNLIEQVQKTQNLLQNNVNARLLLENIMLSL